MAVITPMTKLLLEQRGRPKYLPRATPAARASPIAAGGARMVAVGRLHRYPDEPEVADVAVTVVDEWQGRGTGRLLIADVLSRRPRDVVRLRTLVAASNTASLRMLERVGRVTVRPEGEGVLTVEVDDLPPTD